MIYSFVLQSELKVSYFSCICAGSSTAGEKGVSRARHLDVFCCAAVLFGIGYTIAMVSSSDYSACGIVSSFCKSQMIRRLSSVLVTTQVDLVQPPSYSFFRRTFFVGFLA
jgi:hypothetical protein